MVTLSLIVEKQDRSCSKCIIYTITSIPQHRNPIGSFLSIQNKLLIAKQQAQFAWNRAKSCTEICDKITQICKVPFAGSPAICNLKLSLFECCSKFRFMSMPTQEPGRCFIDNRINILSFSSTYFLLLSNCVCVCCVGTLKKVSFKDRPVP